MEKIGTPYLFFHLPREKIGGTFSAPVFARLASFLFLAVVVSFPEPLSLYFTVGTVNKEYFRR